MNNQKIRIIRKNNDYSIEYQIGDIFTVDSTWYGGVNVTSKTGIPLSLDKGEYEFCEENEQPRREIDPYSYALGAMDCFCEMVSSGLKQLAMSHPCDTKAERDSYEGEVKRLCEKYDIKYFPEDEAFLTDLFPEKLNKGKYNYLFYRTDDILEKYLNLKKKQKCQIENNTYTELERYQTAMDFGRLLSYPETGIERLIKKTREHPANA